MKTDHLYTKALKLEVTNDMTDRNLITYLIIKTIQSSEIARKNVSSRSTGWCAKYVRQALNIAGIPIRKVPRERLWIRIYKRNSINL